MHYAASEQYMMKYVDCMISRSSDDLQRNPFTTIIRTPHIHPPIFSKFPTRCPCGTLLRTTSLVGLLDFLDTACFHDNQNRLTGSGDVQNPYFDRWHQSVAEIRRHRSLRLEISISWPISWSDWSNRWNKFVFYFEHRNSADGWMVTKVGVSFDVSLRERVDCFFRPWHPCSYAGEDEKLQLHSSR